MGPDSGPGAASTVLVVSELMVGLRQATRNMNQSAVFRVGRGRGGTGERGKGGKGKDGGGSITRDALASQLFGPTVGRFELDLL